MSSLVRYVLKGSDTVLAAFWTTQNLSTLTTALGATYAPLASPAFTGNPTAPTQSPGNNTTRLATTAFVTAAVAAGGGGTTVPASTMAIPYWNSGATALQAGNSLTFSGTLGCLGVQVANPTSPLQINNGIGTTLAQPTSFVVNLVGESLPSPPSANATIYYTPVNPSSTAAGPFISYGTGGYLAQGQTITAQVWSYRLINGTYYLAPGSSFSQNITDTMNDGSTNFYIVWEWTGVLDVAGNDEDGYIINITDTQGNNNTYLVTPNTTNEITFTDSIATGSVSPQANFPSTSLSGSGQTFNFQIYGANVWVPGALNYYTVGNTYTVTEALDNGASFIVDHAITNSPSNGSVIKDTDSGQAQSTGALSGSFDYFQTAFIGGAVDTSVMHYGMLSNGTNLTQTFKGYSSALVNGTRIFSQTFATASTNDPNNGQYYTWDITFTVPGGVTEVMLIAEPANVGQLYTSGSSPVDWNGTVPGWVDGTTVTPNTFNPPTFILNETDTSFAINVLWSPDTLKGTLAFLNNAGNTVEGAVQATNGNLVIWQGATSSSSRNFINLGNSTEISSNSTTTFVNAGTTWMTVNSSQITISGLTIIGNTSMQITKLAVGMAVSSATAKLQLAGGTQFSSTSPLKFTNGNLMTTPEAGATEYDGARLWFTPGFNRRPLFMAASLYKLTTQIGNIGTGNLLASASLITGMWPLISGDRIVGVFSGTFGTSGTNGFTLTVSFNGSTVFTSSSMSITSSTLTWAMEIRVNLVSSSLVNVTTILWTNNTTYPTQIAVQNANIASNSALTLNCSISGSGVSNNMLIMKEGSVDFVANN